MWVGVGTWAGSLIIHRKSIVESDADIVPENEALPLRVAEVKKEPMIVGDFLWMPYEPYQEMKDFILSREDDILNDEENFGSLFSVLQWVNRIENDLRSSNTKANQNE